MSAYISNIYYVLQITNNIKVLQIHTPGCWLHKGFLQFSILFCQLELFSHKICEVKPKELSKINERCVECGESCWEVKKDEDTDISIGADNTEHVSDLDQNRFPGGMWAEARMNWIKLWKKDEEVWTAGANKP